MWEPETVNAFYSITKKKKDVHAFTVKLESQLGLKIQQLYHHNQIKNIPTAFMS